MHTTCGIKLFSLLLPIFLFSQSRVGEWKSYPSPLDVRETIEVGDLLVSATSGGLLIYDRTNLTFENITNIDGLAETDLATIAQDRHGHLWLGGAAPNGVVQIYDLENRQPVKTFNFDLWSVSALAVSDSVVTAAYLKDGQWGILEFILRGREFSYRQIYRPSGDNLEVISGLAIQGDSLLAATDRGLFIGDYKRVILNYPENWTTVSELDGKNVSRLRHRGGGMLAIANGEIWSISDRTELLSDIYAERTYLRDVSRDGDGAILLLTKWNLVKLDNAGALSSSWEMLHEPAAFTPLSDGNFAVSSESGLALWKPDREKFEWRRPNAPATNVYTAMAVMDDGRLVAAGPEGISVLNKYGWYNLVPSQEKWSIFSHPEEEYSEFVADTAQFRSSRVWSMTKDEEGVWISFQGVRPARNDFNEPMGGGVIHFSPDEPGAMAVYDTTAGMIAPTNETGYMNVRGLTLDNKSRLWIANFGADHLNSKITVLDGEGKWHHVQQTGNGGIAQKIDNPTEIVRPEQRIAVIGTSKDDGLFVLEMDQDSDGDGTPDVIDIDSDGDGILDPEDLDDDDDGVPDEQDLVPATWRNFSTIHGLADNTVWSLASDSEGDIWALTARGLQRLSFNTAYSVVTPFFFTYYSGVPFGEGSKIIVDGRDNVWLSSITGGLYVLLSNATPWPDWGGFRKESSMLLSNEVTAVAIDDRQGIAYIATSKGINSLKIPFADRKKSYIGLKAFPNPYRIPSSEPMVLDGLKDESSLKIMTLAGRVIRQIDFTSPSVQGYQAFWDGRTNKGEWVSTGVYLVAVYSRSGGSHVTKVAVIFSQVSICKASEWP